MLTALFKPIFFDRWDNKPVWFHWESNWGNKSNREHAYRKCAWLQ